MYSRLFSIPCPLVILNLLHPCNYSTDAKRQATREPMTKRHQWLNEGAVFVWGISVFWGQKNVLCFGGRT